MASINDFGVLDIDPLADPKLGGDDGWAAAVALVMGNSDVPVDSRIATAKEVAVGTITPTSPNVLLWVDTGSNYP